MKRYIDGACGPIESESGYWVYAKDHDHEVEILKDTITDLTHDYYAALDRAERAEAEIERIKKAGREIENEWVVQTDVLEALTEVLQGEHNVCEFAESFPIVRKAIDLMAENERLHEECAARRLDCKRLREILEVSKQEADILIEGAFKAVARAIAAEAEVERLRKELDEKESNCSTLRKMLRGALEREKNKDAEIERLRKECAARRQDCKRLREERDAAREAIEKIKDSTIEEHIHSWADAAMRDT